MKKFVLIVSALLVNLCSVLNAEELKVNGYTISSVTIEQKGDIVKVAGRISDGETCKRLHLEFSLQNDKGKSAKVVCIVKNIESSGSRLFDGIEKLRFKAKEKTDTPYKWEVKSIETKCQQKK